MINLNFHPKIIAIAISIALLLGYTLLVYSAEETGALKAIDKGLEWLQQKQEPDGTFGGYLGFTSLAVAAFLRHPSGKYKSTEPFIEKTLNFIVSLQQEDGSIYDERSQPALPSYNTSVAIMALAAANNPKYDEVIKKAQGYLKGVQCDEGEGCTPDNTFYGGISYGAQGPGQSARADLSNTSMALQALKDSNLEDKELWSKAIKFLERCQNNSETNDQAWATNDGGFIYNPGIKPGEEERTRSYGSMTYAGLMSFLYAGVDKDDQRVQAAVGWIKRNYTVEENPPIGAKGLYYNYHTMAKALSTYGEPVITDAKGEKHNWYKELSQKLIQLQKPEGYWQNEEPQWMETNPILVTTYAVLALEAGFPK
jgi:squalene-hopene/tetraprenyl-beta-curcumene cyclase